MADKEDITLPKATVSKLIKEMLPDDIKCANDTRDLILDCCVEFIHLISSEANEVCAKENKKTIGPEHVIKSLEALGFVDYINEVNAVYDKHKEESNEKAPRGIKKLENQGIPEEELAREQHELFEKAKSALRTSQQNLPTLEPRDEIEDEYM